MGPRYFIPSVISRSISAVGWWEVGGAEQTRGHEEESQPTTRCHHLLLWVLSGPVTSGTVLSRSAVFRFTVVLAFAAQWAYRHVLVVVLKKTGEHPCEIRGGRGSRGTRRGQCLGSPSSPQSWKIRWVEVHPLEAAAGDLTPRPCDCDIIWTRGLCRYHQGLREDPPGMGWP